MGQLGKLGFWISAFFDIIISTVVEGFNDDLFPGCIRKNNEGESGEFFPDNSEEMNTINVRYHMIRNDRIK